MPRLHTAGGDESDRQHDGRVPRFGLQRYRPPGDRKPLQQALCPGLKPGRWRASQEAERGCFLPRCPDFLDEGIVCRKCEFGRGPAMMSIPHDSSLGVRMDGFREIPRGGGMAENVAYHAMEPVSLARIQPRVRHLEREVRVQT